MTNEQPRIEFKPVGQKGSGGGTDTFNVEVNGEAIGTYNKVNHLGKTGNKQVGLVYSRHAGMPAIVPNEEQAVKWLFGLEREALVDANTDNA